MKHLLASAVAGGTLLVCGPTWATNGYFAHGYGTQSKAMAGAGVALSLDSLTPATNPAGVAGLGGRIDAGASLFSPLRGHDVSGTASGACASAQQCTFGVGPQDIDSRNELFVIPHFGWLRVVSPQAVVGISVYGNGGLNTEYRRGSATFGVPQGEVPPGQAVTAPGVFGANDTGVDLTQVFAMFTYARKVNDDLSWGVSPILAAQRFRAKGLGNFAPFSADPQNLSNRGYEDSFGGGVRLGVQGALTSTVRIGASWQSRVYMSEFDHYAGLFAEQGDFDVPSTFTIGAAANLSPTLTAALDVQHIAFSEVDSVGNPLLPNLAQARLGDDGGAGFGWDDVTVIKLGFAVQGAGQRTWRFGYSYADQPIQDTELLFSLLAPAVVEHHFTAGLTQKLTGSNAWSVALMYAPRNSVDGTNPLDPAQRIELEMQQFELELSYSWGR
ncbi:OmpP1/FadL family transporter [Panacagrimonas sp.]|uniref:OmpP1/FadL family transporter n=1 Tax=Panacagrimonas sp. TaxID=2480088 RepID=UPI003B524ABF